MTKPTPLAASQAVPTSPTSIPTESDNRVRNARTTQKLSQLAADIGAIASTIDSYEHVVALLLEVGVHKAGMLATFWSVAPPQGEVVMTDQRFASPRVDNPSSRNEFLALASIAVNQQSPAVNSPASLRGVDFIAVPFALDDQTTGVIGAMVHQSKDSTTEAGLICHWITTSYQTWRTRNQVVTINTQLQSAASALDLIAKISGTQTRRDACTVIANELKQYLECDYVAVGLKTIAATGCELFAVSSTANFDNESKTTLTFKNAFDEAIMHGQTTVFPVEGNGPSGVTLAHKKLQSHMRVPTAITVVLRNDSDAIVGAATFLGGHQLVRQSEKWKLIQALEHPLGSSLELIRAAEGGFLKRITRRIGNAKEKHLPRVIGAAIGIGLLAMLIPMPYAVHCPCVAEPVVRSFSVAPYDGLLETTFAEPGTIVKKGDLLARMDGRAITYEIAGVVADRQRAARKHDQLLANQKVSDAIRSGLERDALQNKLELLQYKHSHLEIVSPVDGIVLSGSVDKRENYPVNLGDTLYEIAPLETLKVELSIPSDEVMHVAQGQSVRLRFDGFGTTRHSATIKRVRPSATVRDDQNVFIADVEMENEDFEIRPGMSGNAKVYGRWRTLGWSLFHLPWERFVTAIGF